MRSFLEKSSDHHSQVLSVDRVLHQGRTAFQDVLIFENRLFGKVLVLDGVVQVTEWDNHIYHEMIAHVPLMAYGQAERVLIIGGGDGGTLKEVLKHPIREAVLIEIDSEVIELSQRFLPDVSAGAFSDPRSTVVVGDGTQYIAQTESQFDVIIIDSTDPVGPGEQLFSETFYRRCRSRLSRGGVIAVQSGAGFHQPEPLANVRDRLARVFGTARPFLAPVPTYAAGALALVVAGSSGEALRPPQKVLRERFRPLEGKTRYYRPEVHRAAFTMTPAFGHGRT